MPVLYNFNCDICNIEMTSIFDKSVHSCRCGNIYCVNHESPEDHKCTYYKYKQQKPPFYINYYCYICNQEIISELDRIINSCRCGNKFCYKHKYPEDHKCTYAYKAEEREKLKKVFH